MTASFAVRAMTLLDRVGPVRFTFVVSLLLSVMALQNALINRDGILYMEMAQALVDHGLAALRSEGRWLYSWPFFPLLVAGLAKLTGLAPEMAAKTLNAALLAGSLALLVDLVRRRAPAAAWAACLVALALPAFNGYRSDILREYGFWFFSLLAFWIVLRHETPEGGLSWRAALAGQLVLGVAALFRLEAVAFYAALMLWQFSAAPAGLRLRRALLVGSLPVAGVAIVALAFLSGVVEPPKRVAYYLDAINPLHKLQQLDEAGKRISDAGLLKYKYSREEAGYILLFGLLSIIPVKFVGLSSLLIVPFGFACAGQRLRALLAPWRLLAWAFLIYVGVLAAFVTHQFFLVGRYVSLLHLLAVPVFAIGLQRMMTRWPVWRAVFVMLLALLAVSNAVSFSAPKTHIPEAGRWLATQATDPARVYVENRRISYYAGWNLQGRLKDIVLEPEALGAAFREGRFDFAALEAKRKDAALDTWLAAQQLRVVREFAHKGGDRVVIVVPADRKE